MFFILKIVLPISQVPSIDALFCAEILLETIELKHSLCGNIWSQLSGVSNIGVISLYLIENQLPGNIFCLKERTYCTS